VLQRDAGKNRPKKKPGSAYPTHILIDKAGNIAHFLVGGGSGRMEQLATLIAALMNEPG
jgi:hypothetical protein